MKSSIGTFILLIIYAEACFYQRIVRKQSAPRHFVAKIDSRRSTFKYNISITSPTTIQPLTNVSTESSLIHQIRNCTPNEEIQQNCRRGVPCEVSYISNGTHEVGNIYCRCPAGYSGPRCHLPGAYTALSNVGTGLIAFAVSAVVITIFVGILFVFLYKKKKAKSEGRYCCAANRPEAQHLNREVALGSLESSHLNGKPEVS
ncbi:DgyrCDS11811 [Dimorphilus gyrociliatus]|uniref:DgyrCDS11811 n=1 Tax=Dimorphilus gyrociliatus TaxID=2664684 RepID=A0A7I8W4K6_9ANNE|nr:DgyrCDS11811 [Dimorphilus gyrociliatus]